MTYEKQNFQTFHDSKSTTVNYINKFLIIFVYKCTQKKTTEQRNRIIFSSLTVVQPPIPETIDER